MRLEKQNIPTSSRAKVNQRLRNYESDTDSARRKLTNLSSDRSALFGSRYTDEPSGSSDIHMEQRQQLLSGTDRLDRSTQRLKASQQLANETEAIGASTLADLHTQRETIEHTHGTLLQSEGYVDRSVKTLSGMARRYCTIPPLKLLFFPCVSSTCGCLTWVQDGYKSGNHDCHHYSACSSYHCRHL